MLSVDLKTLLDDVKTATPELTRLGVSDIPKAHGSLVAIANCGVPLDLLQEILKQLNEQLPTTPDPDLGLKNFERFIVSSRSPMSLSALLVRDPPALSALLNIFSFSQSLTELLIRDPEGFDLIRLTDGQPVVKGILQEELNSEINFNSGPRTVKNRLRQFKNREILRIAYGDLVRKLEIEKTQQQLAYLADSICEVALNYCLDRMRRRVGVMLNKSGQPARFALFGSQRLGTRNLDYSPLLSLIAVCENGVEVVGKQKIKPSEYCERLLDEFTDLLSEKNEYGNCYQVRFDKRVTRGTSRAGTLREFQKYFDQNATTRDRLDLIQTCFVCGDALLQSRFQAIRKQICFRGFFNPSDLAEIQSLKQGLHPNGHTDSGLRNIKSGPGGIHDLEFTVGFLQLLVGRKIPAIQQGDFFEVLYQLEKYEVITREEYVRLKDNYTYLRAVSHCLLLLSAETTDVLPKKGPLANRLHRQLIQHFHEGAEFDGIEKAKKMAEENLTILSHLLQSTELKQSDPLKDFVLSASASDELVLNELRQLGFQNPELAVKAIAELATEKHHFISSARCRYFLASVITDLLTQIAKTPVPEETLSSLIVVSDSLGGKGTLWELFWHNRSCLELYVNLCGNTPYLAGILQSNPGMLDELMDSLTLQREESPEDYRRELDLVCGHARDIQPIVLSFKNSKHLKIGVSQLVGRRSVKQVHAGLAAVADCCIEKIAAAEYEKLAEKHGTPWDESNDEPCLFGIMVGGKVGAQEPNYHSNASFWTVFDSEGKTSIGRGQKSILNQQFFNLLAARVAKSLTINGAQGRLYELEMPPADFGDSSTFAISLEDLKKKCNRRLSSGAAMQFLSQHRLVAADREMADKVNGLVVDILSSSCLSRESWEKVWHERIALEKNASRYNLKRGMGGTLDIEALVHFLYVANFRVLERTTNTVEMLEQLVKASIVDQERGKLLRSSYERLKQIELFLRLMNLPRRHALPIAEQSGNTKDGEIPEPIGISNRDAMLALQPHDSKNSGEASVISSQQSRLAMLMNCDRFESLKKDVEELQKCNRKIVLDLMAAI